MVRPGGRLASRPLHFIWIVDRSGSMEFGGKIQALNTAVREALPHMQNVARDNPNAEVLVRALAFSSGAEWHVAEPTSIEQFAWDDLSAGGLTDLGEALRMVTAQLTVPPMHSRALPPVLVLASDGRPTDDFEEALQQLLREPWGARAVRIAIAIGRDADHATLQQFIANPEISPLAASNPHELTRYIKWASTAALQVASAPRGDDQEDRVLPTPPPPPPKPGLVSETW